MEMIDTGLKTYPFISFNSMQQTAIVNNAKYEEIMINV